MWYEIFKFELKYRIKRPETYLFFVFLFLFSIMGVDFVFEGIDLGPIKKNAPIVIAKTMGALTGIFLILASMIMGVPVLRDFQYNMASLIFVNPIKKRDYLLGRFLGSFSILLFIFSGLLWGIMLGDFMPWRSQNELMSFNIWAYLQPFLCLVLPILFFGAILFFVSGTLSRKLIVVYTQGIFFFVIFLLTSAIEDKFLSALLDPFSLSTLTLMTESWTPEERNVALIPFMHVLLYNRLFWFISGLAILLFGYYKFNFNIIKGKGAKKKKEPQLLDEVSTISKASPIIIPRYHLQHDFSAPCIQLIQHSFFHLKATLQQTSFWAITLCGMVIILINSIDLGTVYGVNSYPATYFIVEELQEMSLYFFIIILLFYSGELIWKEREARINLIYDALPVSDFINLSGKFISLLLTYSVLMISLILSGMLFQTVSGYYHYDLAVYFGGFFIEILPFLILYTFIAFFIQVMINHKFVGQILVVSFFVIILTLGFFGFDHDLYHFGGDSLGTYSDMNGYGHFLWPYLCVKSYWIAFCILLFIVSVVFSVRGTDTYFKQRWQLSKQRWTKSLIKMGAVVFLIFISIGVYIFYNTNVLNSYWTTSQQHKFRAAYEQVLKKYEYLVQPKIVDVNLKVDLYPSTRDYIAEGYYILVNTDDAPISNIHIQKLIADQVDLEYVDFTGGATLDSQHQKFGYAIYTLHKTLQAGDSIKMNFKQTFVSQGFEEGRSNTSIVENGTFFSNDHFTTLGYNKKYELQDDDLRNKYGLSPRKKMARQNDALEVKNGRSGGDGSQINFEMIIGTDSDQIAIAPGALQKEWLDGDRRYFHYKMNTAMINFYAMVSARYERMQDAWFAASDTLAKPVELEIYYHKGHEYNLDRMMEAMKMSLDYFTTHFSPYPYEQIRIMEFPRYAEFAQSFPGTIPFSEAIGFMLNIDDKADVDMAFFITAHELAHQWWGLQVVAGNVQGRHMILETLAQYSALMVLKQKYPKEKVQQFLKMELDSYFKGKASEKEQELPLALVEKQDYIYYSKGAINLYALQDYISEDSVNLALQRFIVDWNAFDDSNSKNRYATTADLLAYFKAVSPDSMHYLITDLFEKVIRFDLKMSAASYTKIADDEYRVKLTAKATKYETDRLGIESAIHMNDWIDIGIYGLGSGGEAKLIYLEKHKVSGAEVTLEVVVNQLPYQVGIDPLYKLIDNKTEDNVISVSNL